MLQLTAITAANCVRRGEKGNEGWHWGGGLHLQAAKSAVPAEASSAARSRLVALYTHAIVVNDAKV